MLENSSINKRGRQMLLFKRRELVYSFLSWEKERKRQGCSTVSVLSIMTPTFDLSSVKDVTHLDPDPVPPGSLMAI